MRQGAGVRDLGAHARGCELLVQKIYQHIVATREAEKPHVEVDPRFDAARDQAVDEDRRSTATTRAFADSRAERLPG